MLGPVLQHEKKTQSTYSLFGATLKSLETELKNLMAFGTDDEKVLVGGGGSMKASNEGFIYFVKSTFVKILTQNWCL